MLLGVHVPFWQVPPVQAVPFATFCWPQPVVGLQAAAVHSLLSGGHAPLFGVLTHAPVAGVQLSVVQATLSSHDLVECRHVPLSQTSVVQPFESSHSAFDWHPVWHAPPWQVPAPLMHAVPSATGVLPHPVDVSQVSVVHSLLSLQTTGRCMQAPAEQVSVVHALSSLQSASIVHWPPGTHTPLSQLPPWHGVPLAAGG